ncbi:MAG: M20/M25/M40 family metallo-hydrolase [Acetobacteraceae bacterium]|nr:M20/M25/M40 family metallo-hydrolase [Acetobacteraceae bacterium]
MADPAAELFAEAREHLASLVRIDTSNPPGNEISAARYLEAALRREGIWCQVFEPAPGRGNMVARLPGEGNRRPLLLMAHLDVVPADPQGWTCPPFSGAVREGELWGRGALDCKHIVAGWLTILLRLKRLGARLRRDVILAATADEECGGRWGTGWLADHRPDLMAAEVALNEGGGAAYVVGGRRVFTCDTGEKGVCWLRLSAGGEGGHASVPPRDNPVVRLASAVSCLGQADFPVHLTPVVERLFTAALEHTPQAPAATLQRVVQAGGRREDLEALFPRRLAGQLYATLRNTATPTVFQAGGKTNVVPARAWAEVDGRFLPGFTVESFLEELRSQAGSQAAGLDWEVTMAAEPSESSPAAPLLDCLARAIERHSPGSLLAPSLCVGMTDGRYLRRLGVPVYGFWPELPHVPLERAHGVDERLPLDSLRFALAVMWDAIADFCLG